MNATSKRMELFFQWQPELRQNIHGFTPSWNQELYEAGLPQGNSLDTKGPHYPDCEVVLLCSLVSMLSPETQK